MSLKQLEYFLELSRTLNYTKAAANLYVSQTAVTKQIQNLEYELGVKLFERNNKRVRLTEIGQMYVKEAELILGKAHEAFEHVEAFKRGERGMLNIGFLKDFDTGILIGLIQRFHLNYPSIELKLGGYTNHTLNDKLKRGELDLIICMDSSESDGLAKWNLGSYPLAGIVHREDKLAGRTTVRPEELHHLVFDVRASFEERRHTELEGALLKVACHMGEAIAHEFVVNMELRRYVKILPLEPYQVKNIYLMHDAQPYNQLVPHFVQSCRDEKSQ